MNAYDLALAWNWEYDADLVALLAHACQEKGVQLVQITAEMLEGTLHALRTNEVSFWAYFDRATDADASFLPLAEWAREHCPCRINPYELAVRAWDKVAMHVLLSAQLDTPNTLILPSYQDQPALPPFDLSPLGSSFYIKPAHGGGGSGVVLGATTVEQVLSARQEYPADAYLLQAEIAPITLGERPAWFRVLYCTGAIFPCWWHPTTHAYTLLAPDEEQSFALAPLREVTATIARLCGLHLFSSEIAHTPDGRFVVVDYVNDPIDLRLQSTAADGVPDEIVREIVARIVALVVAHRNTKAELPSTP